MVRKQSKIERKNGPPDENGDGPLHRYFVDAELAETGHRALSLMIAGKRCFVCQQADEEKPSASADVNPYIKRIVQHCSQESDYMLPDTPIKEAIFRVLLSGGKKLMNAQEISDILSEKWALTAYPRDISRRVIQRLLEHSESYCIAQVPEPESEESSEEQ